MEVIDWKQLNKAIFYVHNDEEERDGERETGQNLKLSKHH